MAWAAGATDPELAASLARQVLVDRPGNREALLLLATLRVAGDAEASASSVLAGTVPPSDRDADAWFDIGRDQLRAGRLPAAAAALTLATTLRASAPQPWLALAEARHRIGDDEGADAAFQAYLSRVDMDIDLSTAQATLAAGHLDRAERLLRERLKTWPCDVAALRMLAEIQLRRGGLDGAEQALQQVLAMAPGFDGARQNLAVVLYRCQRHAEALAETEALLARDPANPMLQEMKVRLLERIGDVEGAVKLYQKLIGDHPAQPGPRLGLGHALKTAGRTTEAVDAYRGALRLDPGFGVAWWSIANLKTVRFDAADIATMQAQLARAGLDPESRTHLEFALGKALEDSGDAAASFHHYAAGNRLRRGVIGYDADQNSARTHAAMSVYTRELFDARVGSGNPSPEPVFVVGMPRAGSTLVEQILSSHPAIEGTMELPAVISITRELRARGADAHAISYHEVAASLTPVELEALGTRYLDRTRAQRKMGRPFFIDKMPNNFAHIGLIQLMLPNARIVDVRRHPLACCFSNFKQLFAHGQAFSYDLEDLGRYYRDYVELMAHFDAVLPGRVHRVYYESLVSDTEREVRSLLAHCGLDFDEGCLRFHENRRAVRTASSAQVRKPIYRDGVDHWRQFDVWLEPLKRGLGPVLEAYPAVPG